MIGGFRAILRGHVHIWHFLGNKRVVPPFVLRILRCGKLYRFRLALCLHIEFRLAPRLRDAHIGDGLVLRRLCGIIALGVLDALKFCLAILFDRDPNALFIIIVYNIRIELVRQQRLNEREDQQHKHDREHCDCHLVFKEHAERAAPVGIVGISRALGFFFIVFRKLKEFRGKAFHFLSGKIILFADRKAAQPLFDALLQLPADFFFLRVFAAHLAPSFLAKLMRGSTRPIRMSPSNRPMMLSAAKITTSATIMLLSWRLMTSTSKPPMPGME